MYTGCLVVTGINIGGYGASGRFLIQYDISTPTRWVCMFAIREHCDKVMQLWSPIREKAYWAVLCIVNDRELTEDVLQEALITAIEKFQTLRDESKFEPWLLKIAVRKAYETLAKRNSVPAQSIDAEYGYELEAAVPDDAFALTQYKDIVSRIMNCLKPESKKYLFYLKYIEDRPMEDIIRITGMKEGTLKSVYFRMRKELGLMLGKEYGENG